MHISNDEVNLPSKLYPCIKLVVSVPKDIIKFSHSKLEESSPAREEEAELQFKKVAANLELIVLLL